MTVRVNKDSFNLREKLSELERPIGLKGSDLMSADTAQEARDLVSAGRKNLVINGSMMINQRGNKTGYVGSSNEVHHGPDRFLTSIYGTVSINQSSDVPEGYGFEYSKELLCAATSTHTNRYLTFIYRMEGYDSMVFNYGTSKAKHVTLSFWIKSNKACDISVNFENEQNPDRGYQVKQTINNVDTWEKKIVTIPGDTARTLTTGPQKAFCFDIFLSAPGSNFTGGTPSESWTDLANNERGAHCNADFYDSTSNYFRVTGVQLELGKNATEFEHRSYGEELALCERYFEKIWQNNNSQSPNSGGDGYNTIASGAHNGSYGYYVWKFRTQKRVRPSLDYVGKFRVIGGGSITNLTINEFYSPGLDAGRIRSSHSGSTGQAFVLEFDGGNSSNGYLSATAEL